MMKKILIIFLFISSVVFAKETIDLKINKKDFFSKPFLLGAIVHNVYDYPLIIQELDFTKFHSFLYEKKLDKFFWLNSEIFITILQRYQFINSNYIYFVTLEADEKERTRGIILKVNLEKLKQYNQRDFGEKDKKLLNSNNIIKYKLPSAYDLLETFDVMAINNDKLNYSAELTKKYKVFIKDFAFESIGELENKILENKKELQDLKENIHHYCIKGTLSKIKLYTQLGFNLDKLDSDNKQTCLQYTAINGHYKTTKYLINHGADVNKHRKGFENAYLAAKRLGHKKIARLLKPLTKTKSRYVKSSLSSGGRYITNLGIDEPSYNWSSNTVWYKGYVSISDGSHIYAKVERSGGCYSLLIGSNDSSIYGNCSNCSNSINSYWSCNANGVGSFNVNGNQAEAANAIVKRSR